MVSSQHPGCPGFPQQRLTRRILTSMFWRYNHNRTRHGPGAICIILSDLLIPVNMPSSISEAMENMTGNP